MADPDKAFVVPLRGPGWAADLRVAPPTDSRPPANFDVTGTEGGPLRQISARVLYTTATNEIKDTGWGTWHVKIYHCENHSDADLLRRHLRRQAADIQRANAHIEGPARTLIRPPWAVVPVQIVAGDRSTDPGPAPRTDLVQADDILDRIRATLPSWFGVEEPQPELFLLAFSPQLEQVPWVAYRTVPGVEHLIDFLSMAKGLDTLHKRGTVHCDIKPDNVCRYNNTDVGSGFVLIDADAATRMDPPPKALRTTERYVYKGVRDWLRYEFRQKLAIDAGRLRAQDRFGFAIVVLVALAGRDWVETELLTHQDDEGEEIRRADDRSAVIAALRQHWRDDRWEPLIQAVTEPFDSRIEDFEWSAAEWVERLLDAERASARMPSKATENTAARAPTRMDRELQKIREYARAIPAPRPQASQRAYEAVQRRAVAVAARAAVYSALPWAAVPVVVVLVVLIGALGLGK
jgi:hypothetical protein